MPLMKTANPALRVTTFENLPGSLPEIQFGEAIDTSKRMTLSGTVNKTGLLLVLAVAAAAWTWRLYFAGAGTRTMAIALGAGAVGGLIVALVTAYKKQWSPLTAPIYALLEGLVLGAGSSVSESRFPGIAIQAVVLTFGTLFVMLLVYATRIVRVSQKFQLGVIAASGGVLIFYMVELVLHHYVMDPFDASGPYGMITSLVVASLAALVLLLDFDFIEQGVKTGAPKYMEWYGAFGLIVTLVWLYIEVLHLLTMLRGRD
jgi:uncharacterized YccA/Bax inhibitor family protein